jgi:hypothetical protein
LYQHGGKDLPELTESLAEGGAKGKTSGALDSAKEKVGELLHGSDEDEDEEDEDYDDEDYDEDEEDEYEEEPARGRSSSSRQRSTRRGGRR